MKKWKKGGRKFLNTEASGCLGVVAWSVAFCPGDPKAKNKWEKRSDVDADFRVTDEGKSIYVHRKAHLKSIRTIRAELDKFDDACVQAFADMEAHDGKAD